MPWVVCSTVDCAAPVSACSTCTADCVALDAYFLLVHQTVVPWMCLFYSKLCCLWTCPFYSRLWFPGHVCITCTLYSSVCCPWKCPCVLWQPVLSPEALTVLFLQQTKLLWTCLFYSRMCCSSTCLVHSSLSCTWMCLVYSSLCCPGTFLFYSRLCCPWMCMFHCSLCRPSTCYKRLCAVP
jgi:hypothetical protein